MIPFKIKQTRTGLGILLNPFWRKTILRGTMPSSFDDITFDTFMKLRKTTDEYKMIEILTGIQIGSWLTIVNQKLIISWLEWFKFEQLEQMDRPHIIFVGKERKPIFTQDDIGEDTFAQKIFAQRRLKDCKTIEQQVEAIPDLIAIYLQPLIDKKDFDPKRLPQILKQIKELPVSIVIPLGNYYIKELDKIITRENLNLKYQPDKKEILAGVSLLDKFGEKNLIDALAGGDILKHDDVLMLSYNMVFLKLWQDNVKSKIQKRYANIKD